MPKWTHYYSCLGNCLSCLCAKYCLFMCHPDLGGDFLCGSCRLPQFVYYSLMILTFPLGLFFFFIGLMIDITASLLWVITGGCFCCCCPPVITTDFTQAITMSDDANFCRRFAKHWTIRWFNYDPAQANTLGLFFPTFEFLKPDELVVFEQAAAVTNPLLPETQAVYVVV